MEMTVEIKPEDVDIEQLGLNLWLRAERGKHGVKFKIGIYVDDVFDSIDFDLDVLIADEISNEEGFKGILKNGPSPFPISSIEILRKLEKNIREFEIELTKHK